MRVRARKTYKVLDKQSLLFTWYLLSSSHFVSSYICQKFVVFFSHPLSALLFHSTFTFATYTCKDHVFSSLFSARVTTATDNYTVLMHALSRCVTQIEYSFRVTDYNVKYWNGIFWVCVWMRACVRAHRTVYVLWVVLLFSLLFFVYWFLCWLVNSVL